MQKVGFFCEAAVETGRRATCWTVDLVKYYQTFTDVSRPALEMTTQARSNLGYGNKAQKVQ